MVKEIETIAESIKEAPGHQVSPKITPTRKAGLTGKMGQVFARTRSSLFIEDTSLRLLVARGKVIVKWAEMPLGPGEVCDGVITDPRVMAGRIKNFLKVNKVSCNKLTIGFSGLHCLSRVITLPPLSNTLLKEAVYREAESELPVPLENLYLAWQIIQTSPKEIKVFLIAYSRNIVDSLIKTLPKAGIKSHLMDLAPLAIIRTAYRKSAVVMDIRSSGIDIVIMEEGVPQLIRSLPLPQEKPLADKLPIIKDELERTLKFYNSAKPEISNEGSLPIFVTGQLQDEPELFQYLSEELGSILLSPLPVLVYPDQMSPFRYMVNIGLLLKTLSLKGSAGYSLINLNALPEIYRPRQVAVGNILAVIGAFIAAGIVIIAFLAVQNLNHRLDSSRTDLKSASQFLTQRQAQQKTLNEVIKGLEKQVADSTRVYTNLDSTQKSILAQQEIVANDLLLAADSLRGMTLLSLKHTGDVMTVSGIGPSEADVLTYAGILEKSGRYSEIEISGITDNADLTVSFTLNMKVKG